MPGETFNVDDDEQQTEQIHIDYKKPERIERIEKAISLLLRFDNDYSYSLISGLFNLVTKTEKKKPNVNWKLINDLCDVIPPEKLRTSCQTIEIEVKGERKPMELASDRENWYACKSKALIKLSRFQECFDRSKKALESFDVFHYSNDSWFARRIALSMKNMGLANEAIVELEKVLQRKKEWYIQKELAALYHENGEAEKAFRFAIQAITNFGKLEYKVDLLFLIGELLRERNENDLAAKHFWLAKLIRLKERWGIPQKLAVALAPFEQPDLPVPNDVDLKNYLKRYWDTFRTTQNSHSGKSNETMVGAIEKILHNNENGADGFIKYAGNRTIYFRLNAIDKMVAQLNPGLKVEFKVQLGENKKEKAIQLKAI